ncbi:MAG: hypothetical protein ACRDJC_03680 [Thermomicrobiales bacterium]
MTTQSAYGLTRELTRRAAAAVTRRHSFLTLGAATLTAAAAPKSVEAGKAGKKARKKCKRQRGKCRASVEEFCEGDATCESSLLPCCDPLATCNAGASTECLLTSIPN